MTPKSQQVRALEDSISVGTTHSDIPPNHRESDSHDSPEESTRPLVSIIIVAYAAARFLPTCLLALQRQTYTNHEILLVDTTPDDRQTAAVAQQFPYVRFIAAPKNLGYAGGNNLGFTRARGTYIAILNPDTEPDPEWLAALVVTLTTRQGAGLATSKIVLADRRDTINTCGNDVHYTGLATCRGLGEPAATHIDSSVVPAISGAAFLIRSALFAELGGFDERFFMYLEDTDLSWRARLIGWNCIFVPASIVAHHYTTTVYPTKLFYLERNRGVMLLQNFHWQTLALLAPALILTEIITWGFALLQGPKYLGAKLGSYRWLIRHARHIGPAHRHIQQTRRVSDADIIDGFGHRLDVGQIASPLIALPLRLAIDPLFRWWQRKVIGLSKRYARA